MKKSVLSVLAVIMMFGTTGRVADSRDENNNVYEQPTLGYRIVEILEVEGYKFKDLNKNGILDIYEDWRRPDAERAADLVSQMTLEEKAGSMVHSNMVDAKEDGSLNYEGGFPGLGVGVSINEKFVTEGITRSNLEPKIFAKYTNSIQEVSEGTRLGIPFSISSDPRNHVGVDQYGVMQQGEGFSMWPQPIGLGATGNEEILREFGDTVRQEYRALGIHTALHPQIDLPTEPRWGRISGNLSEDAELTAKLGVANIKGLQGEELGPDSVIAMAKHFSGGGPQEDGWDAHFEHGQNQVYPGNNFDYHLLPFKAAIEAGVMSMMPYYGVPIGQTAEDVGMAFNKEIITDLLKGELGFRGIICTDWGVINNAPSQGGFLGMPWGVMDLTEKERIAKALHAGVDQFGGLDDPAPIIAAVRDGLVAEERLTSSLIKLMKNKFALGLFENPYVDVEKSEDIVGKAAFQEAADHAQRKSIVLLKNKNDVLPLSKGAKLYLDGVSPETAEHYGTLVDSPAEADYAIIRVAAPYYLDPDSLFFGMHAGTLAYEGATNASELDRIKAVLAAKGEQTKVIVDMYMDRPAILTEFIDDIDGMFASFGVFDYNFLDVLFGHYRPTAKLPFELPSSMAEVEAQYEDVPYDTANPLFEFGFGLTYLTGIPDDPTTPPVDAPAVPEPATSLLFGVGLVLMIGRLAIKK